MVRFRTHVGFTLLELLVGIVLVALMTATVASSLPSQSSRLLRTEAHRLAEVLESQRVHAVANEIAQSLVFTNHQLFIEKENAQGPAPIWSSDAIQVVNPPRWVVGPEPFGSKVELQVVSGDDPEQSLYVGTDGVRAFGVKNTGNE
jgi:type II secretory pathway pseudopilin PulG